mgnify:FL=1
MKIILALITLTLPLHARLGENIDQLIARYGTRPKVRLVRGGEVWTFTTPAMTITVENGGFAKPVSVVERFTKRDGSPFSEVEVKELTLPITQAVTYTLPIPTTDDDGAKRWHVIATKPKAKGFVLTLSADGMTLTVEPLVEKKTGI